ncbi:MAG TPA: hypothetical protein VD962_06970 [Rubricoccaceae bacterium]|nr:hypothetical protein [Rubricoccaceae bacterium]
MRSRFLLLLGGLLFTTLPVAAQPDAATQIGRIREEAGSTEWADRVESVLVGQFDRNNSGTIDTRLELAQVTCDIWQALEAAHPSVLEIYGFAPDYIWVGYAFGFDESLRQTAYEEGFRCITGGADPDAVLGVYEGATGGDAAADLRAISASSFYGGWDDAAGRILVRHFDSNGSGMLEAGETGLFGCDVWREVATAYEREYGESDFWIGMGFREDLIWNAEGLQIAESARASTWSDIQECFNLNGGSTSGTGSAAADLRALSWNDFYADFDDQAGDVLVRYYDRNGSGSLEAGEVGSITCADWMAIQSAYQRAYSGSDFWIGMGFREDLIWNAEGLQIAEGARAASWASIQNCFGMSSSSSGTSNSPYVSERLAYINEQFRLYNTYNTSWSVDENARTWSVTDEFGTVTGDLATTEVRGDGSGNLGIFCVSGGTCVRGYDGPTSSYTMGLTTNGNVIPHFDAVIRQFQEIRSYVLGGTPSTAVSPYVGQRLDYINEQFRLYNEYDTSWGVNEATKTWWVTDRFGTVTGDMATSEVRTDGDLLGIFCTSGGTCLRGYNGPESSYTMALSTNGRTIPHLSTVIQKFREIRSHVMGR